MERKWLTGAAVVTAMLLLAGCGNAADGADISVRSDEGEIQAAAGGPVKEDSEEQDTVSVTETEPGERELLYRVLFHHPDDGNPEDDEVLYEYEYDEAGRLLSESNYNLKSRTEYGYDVSGRLVKSEEYFGDDFIYWAEYEYDVLGYLTRKTIYEPDGDIGHYIEYENDSLGNVLREISYNGEGDVTDSVEYTYDTSGNLVKEAPCREDSPNDYNASYFEYLYDTSGNLLRKIWYLDDELRGYDEYVYDSSGNLTREEVHYIFGLTGEDILDHYFEYTYDESGALLTQVLYDRDGSVFYDTAGERFVQCYRYEYVTVSL